MYIRQTEDDAFYACPKYYPENREPDEQPCMNRISVTEMEHVLDALSEKKQEDEEDGGECYLKNYAFATRIGKYKVLEEKEGLLKIQALNKKARLDI
jgi:hypothetical protein